ncbi:hypothetical protein GCM10022221_67760 [Actinocorallia aurea]
MKNDVSFKKTVLTWEETPACKDQPFELFFPPDGVRGEALKLLVADAKQICNGCPLRIRCADYALNKPEKYGVWGGLDEDERTTKRRRVARRRSASGQAA